VEVVRQPLSVPPPVESIVICPGVLVVIVIFIPAIKLPTTHSVELAIRSCPWVEGAVLIPVPPLPIANGFVSVKEVKDGVVVTLRVTFPVKAPPPVKLVPAMTCVELETLLLNVVQSVEERNPD